VPLNSRTLSFNHDSPAKLTLFSTFSLAISPSSPHYFLFYLSTLNGNVQSVFNPNLSYSPAKLFNFNFVVLSYAQVEYQALNDLH